MSRTYKYFISELAKINAQAPRGKTPKLLNYHTYVPSPYRDLSDTPQTNPSKLYQIPLALRSTQYLQSGRVGLAEPKDPSEQQFVRDLPLPKVLIRHIREPSNLLDAGSSAGKILGFRIQLKGRVGTRSRKQMFFYGKLEQRESDRSHVDFAKSQFTAKNGANGVKVWVAYGR
ncbi:hypothetical protein HK104_008036 [Borealophlyctis nickersoniae]|nr:hypothetical protein HK104_008036 [Borealophlyctis nickersoniae]